MPNYDIIPLATDLLDYTIQRVKVKEPQYTKVKAYVMENGQMVEKELFEKIKDDGKPHFPKSQTFHMCADMQRMASAILQKCNSADGRYAVIFGYDLFFHCAPRTRTTPTTPFT